MSKVAIVEARDSWPAEFADLADALGSALGGLGTRIDHIGSTSVPGLASKDVIDVQITVASHDHLDLAANVLAAAGYPVRLELHDHLVPGEPEEPTQWIKRFARERPGQRRAHLHVRIEGRANQRYALLFRDFLCRHPETALAYAAFKRGAAQLLPDNSATYAELKDPVCDLIFLHAREWATRTSWTA